MTAKNLEELIAEKRQDPSFMAEIERGSAVLIAVNALLVELDALRIQQGWTKADLARAAGMHPSNLRKMLSSGEKNIELETLIKLLHALDVEITLSPLKVTVDSANPRTVPQAQELEHKMSDPLT